MSYSTIYQSVNDPALKSRVVACCAQEGSLAPESTVMQVIWPVCSSPDVEAAYASALAAGNENPGGDPSVITDGMILSKVQANWPPPVVVEE